MAEDGAPVKDGLSNGGAGAGAEVAKDRLPFLRLKTNAIFNRLERLAGEMDTEKLNTMDEYSLTASVESLHELKSTFTVTHTSLEELDFDAIASELPSKFDAILVNLRATLQREIGKRNTSQHCSTFRMNTTETPSIVVNANRSRLPLLTLPKFNGAYTEWANFYSMFMSVIDRDTDLTRIDKLQHLRSCLSGPALDTIRALEISENNYITALDLLQKRFNNKRLIFQAHIREIFGLEKADATVGKLRELTDKITAHIRALQTLGSKEQISDCIIVQLLTQKLDKASQAKWEETSPINELPSWDQLSAFLEKRCRTLENVEHSTQQQSNHASKVSNSKNVSTTQKRTFVVSNSSLGKCTFCGSSEHLIYQCQSFAHLSPNLRQKEAKKLGFCINCLRKGHQMRDCKSGSCRTCQSKHHTMLHFDRIPAASSTVTQPAVAQSNAMTASMSPSPHAYSPPDAVLLATAIVLIKNQCGTFVPCRALLDSGSQLHFITTRFANQLQLRKTKSLVSVSGIGDANFSTDGYSVDIVLKSRTSDFASNITAVVVRTITDNQPSLSVSTADWKVPSNIQLADPNFNLPQRIDLLIGAGLFFELLCVGQIQLAPGLPLLQKTLLGWVLSGGSQQTPKLSSLVVSRNSSGVSAPRDTICNSRLDNLVRRFWEIEHVCEPISKTTKEELDCEMHFKQNYSRLHSGEYSVRLPMKYGPDSLGDSYLQAFRRFKNLEKKLSRDPHLKEKYCEFMKEYLDLNHMSLVPSASALECKYFLPHHCVTKDDSTTTKLRVVFDGSATTTSGSSLNDLLMAGPTIQPKLFNILIRFRTFPIALTGDICKMYRCVRVIFPDNMLQCILWRESPEEDLRIYKLETVTYGTKAASFLAIRAMHQLAGDESLTFPLGAKIILRDFYVDDLISGGNSVEEALDIKQQTTSLLKKGNFQLRKWCSNNSEILHNIPEADRERFLKFDDGSEITKALGLVWDPVKDMFLFSFKPPQPSRKHSKRSVLSTIASFYDPLGLIGPTLTKAKIIMQRMWRDKLEWDESLPYSLETAWSEFCRDFAALNRSSFPRYVLQPGSSNEIHAFCDASLEAYGACIYTRSIKGDNIQTHLLCSKARVAPLKTLTVPKLELCAAALLAQLVGELAKMKLFNCRFLCWSDSSVVLSWVREESSKFNVFVANRICAIQQLTQDMEWRYVPTAMNPADILSRGAGPHELITSDLWMHGPSFLKESETNWPKNPAPPIKLPEVRQRALFTSNDRVDISLSFKFINSFHMMQRIFGYVSKFIKFKNSTTKTPQLTSADIHHGTQLLLRIVQRAQLWPEYAALQNNTCVHKSSSIASLSPFLDNFGLIRVGGRLRHSTLDFEARHPCILPKNHPLTLAIITHYHRKHHHAGPQALLASIRMKFWPIGGRKTVASAVGKCIICCRSRPRLVEHIMADLPKERIQTSRAFIITGVDYCGPFYYTPEMRNKSPQKCYVCIFICFSTKAVWMELVKDLSTSAFLQALKRFIATRGTPSCIWSDNATNFVGARNELKDLRRLVLSEKHREEVHNFCLSNGFDWRFIPPRSPHFGGLWEAAVKMAKQHFYRSVGSSLLGYDELRTLVCEISAVINSRPLVSISENPEDLDVLTPGHFLIGGPLTALPEPDVTHLNYNRLDRWQRVTQIQQVFWKRWSQEYLTLLQQRTKWRTPQTNIKVNDIVCIKDENTAPLNWPLARVKEIITGEDGVARVAILRTSTGTTRRAVNKLCVLPVTDTVESPNLSTGGGCSES